MRRIFYLALLVAVPAFAQLGLTESQCAGKFRQHEYTDAHGKRVVQRPPPDPNRTYGRLFHLGNMAVTITFLRDRSVGVDYVRPDKMRDEEWEKLSYNIRMSLLGDGQTWVDTSTKGVWWLSDKSARVHIDQRYVNLRAASVIPADQGGAMPDTTPKASDYPFPAQRARR